MRKMFGAIISVTPTAIVVGFIVYSLSPVLLFYILSFILIVDIVGWLVWFVELGQAIAHSGENKSRKENI